MTSIRRRPLPPPTFREVNAKRSTPAFRAYMGQALELLRTSPTPIGQATYKYIASGKVKVDGLTDLTRPDFERVRKSLGDWGIHLSKDDFERLPDKRTRVSRAVRENMHGYMWDDRIYVESGLTPQKLAATLVHEVNHVINKSEENYRGDTNALVQEYRAFYAERVFAGETMTPAKCRALKLQVAKDYGFDKARLSEIPDLPPGRMIPR